MIIREPADVLVAGSAEPLELGPELLAELRATRAAMLAGIDSGDAAVYGVNTGMGRLAGVRLTALQQEAHQRNLLVGRAVGGPPWLSPELARALLLMRLRGFVRGDAAVSAELTGFLVDRLNDRFLPAVPRDGLGSAGEIIPLAHAFQTFLGIGFVLENGERVSAADALERRGVEPFVLGPKEGASLIQGSPLAEAYAWLCARQVRRLVEAQTVCAALVIDLLGAPQEIYRYPVAGEYARRVLAEVGRLVEGAAVRADVVQAPISVRVAPRVVGFLDQVRADLEATLRESWETPADSPSFLDGRFVPTTGYHAAELGLRMDAVKAALVHVAEVAVQRMHRLLDPQFSGLPPQLSADPGPQAGLTPLHKRAVGELHAMRRSAAPATLGSLDTSAGQEDVQAFAWAAGAELEDAVRHLFAITACELIAIRQARYLVPEPHRAAPGLRAAHAWLAETVEPIPVDRPLGVDVERVAEACRDGSLPRPG
ncbi:aromatic amino acid lyase [Amycolatopsis jiangsuensis]|uniref:Histidine ammonia-lyase n=1 Tax=Amycolatopsis jiangsuensis TaxID=1181879 RepID=A0A840IYR5_9PSEU|nr:aromatic amino acid lyase [Amycolatopsis jiangsuensis]MBB4686649.1 histidine ammonia-lyase [Amycolatopsis jiangsuensis]